jgi:Prefoldin subunit
MLAYPIDEAEEMLDSKLSAAKQGLANCEEDLDFLREQITVRKPRLSSKHSDLPVFRLWRSILQGYLIGM